MSIRGFRLLLFTAIVSAIAGFTLVVPPKVMAANATLTISLHEGSDTGPKVNPQGVSVTATHGGAGAMPTPITLALQGSDYVWTTTLAPGTCVRLTDVACTFFVTARDSQGKSLGATIVAVAAGNNTGIIVVPAAPTTGTLHGTVTIPVATTPPENRPMQEGSTVTATNTATSATFTYKVTSQAGGPPLDGTYILTGLPPGTYNVVFEGTYNNYPLSSPPVQNFKATRNGVTINAGDNVLNITQGDADIAPQELCDAAKHSSLNYFFCPLINQAADTIKGLDGAILCLLKINTGRIFNDTTGDACWGQDTDTRTAQSSTAYHLAWGVFRNISLALLVIIGLAMVVSQILNLDMFDAYTIRKALPRILIAVIALTLSWNIMHFLFTMSNASADAIRSLISEPFKTIDAGIGTSPGDIGFAALLTVLLAVGTPVAVLALSILGIGGILALVASILLGVFSAWILLEARDVVAAFLIIASPFAIICAAFKPFEKVFDVWQTLLITILLSVPAIAALIQISHVGALISYVNNQTTAAFIILLAGYALIWGVFKQLDSVAGKLGDVASSATARARKGLAQYRSNQMKNRSRVWQEGDLFNNRGVGGLMNNMGRRIGYGKALSAETGKGGLSGFGLRRRGAKAEARRAGLGMYDAVVQSRREKGEFQSEIANNDDANAVNARALGDENNLEAAAQSLFRNSDGTYDAARGATAIANARALGGGRASAMTSFRTMMKNKARAVGAGDVRWLEETARGLTNNEAEYQRLANDAAFWARSNGRMDLGGTAFIGSGRESVGADGRIDMTQHYNGENETYRNARNVYQAARGRGDSHDVAERTAWQVVADANMIDGFGRVPPGAIEGAHDNTIIQAAETFSRILASPTAGTHEKMQAAMGLKEMHSSRIASSGTGRDELNTALDALGIDMAQSIDQQLADRVGVVGLTGEQLARQARAYQDVSYGGQQMVAGPDGTPIPLPTPIRPTTGGAIGVPAGVVIQPTATPNVEPPPVPAPTPTPKPSRISIVEPPRVEPGHIEPGQYAAGQGMASIKSGRATYVDSAIGASPPGPIGPGTPASEAADPRELDRYNSLPSVPRRVSPQPSQPNDTNPYDRMFNTPSENPEATAERRAEQQATLNRNRGDFDPASIGQVDPEVHNRPE